MRLSAEAGAWTAGSPAVQPPGVAVLELDGAVLEWTIDEPGAPPRLTFTDIESADWLWRVVGEPAHVALLAATDGVVPEEGRVLEVDAELRADALAPLRRLALGHWLRRWWPASARDGIVALDPVLLDGELALLTAELDQFHSEEAYEAELDELLRPHRAALAARTRGTDPRVAELASACAELADELGLPAPLIAVEAVEQDRARSDYALAAGTGGAATGDAIARGVGSVHWPAVPPGCFDAAERTVDWSIVAAGDETVATVRVAASASVAGIEVRLRSGGFSGLGVLDAEGRATLPLIDGARRPVAEDQAWNHDWPQTTVTVGADSVGTADSEEASALRARVRDFARARLATPGHDAFLAEVLAAESDY